MTRYYHDSVLYNFLGAQRRCGYAMADEVGIPGGRIDAVRLDKRNRWVELYELKVRKPEDGIPQLVRYAAEVPGKPLLTLVVDMGVATPALKSLAAESGVRVREFSFASGFQLSLVRDEDVGRWVFLPYIVRREEAVA